MTTVMTTLESVLSIQNDRKGIVSVPPTLSTSSVEPLDSTIVNPATSSLSVTVHRDGLNSPCPGSKLSSELASSIDSVISGHTLVVHRSDCHRRPSPSPSAPCSSPKDGRIKRQGGNIDRGLTRVVHSSHQDDDVRVGLGIQNLTVKVSRRPSTLPLLWNHPIPRS